ncbi:helix-turn-helix domain-containing protein [Viridibacillus arvi]|uniref:helix-turn-helix domain-containing protein n=1 Tax=Viridibacillus arvi TaxID=263475 RepID=UPI0036E28E3D
MQGLEEVDVLKTMMSSVFKEIVTEYKTISKEWFSLKEAAEYIGVSPNTLAKYREMGLKVFVVEGVSRVSRKEIDRFLETHSN